MATSKLSRGDVFVLPCKFGKLFFQYLEKNEDMGHLIRVLTGHPDGSEGATSYFTFFPLSAALRRRVVSKVGSYPLPANFSTPTMRRAGGVAADGRVINWWIIYPDGCEVLVDSLTEDQKALSLYQIVNDTMLIDRFEQGWRPSARA